MRLSRPPLVGWSRGRLLKFSELNETVAPGIVVEEVAKRLRESDRTMVREGDLLSPIGVGGIGIAQRVADVYSQVEEPVA